MSNDNLREIPMDKITTAEDWAELLKKISVETIEIDENGHYDPKKTS